MSGILNKDKFVLCSDGSFKLEIKSEPVPPADITSQDDVAVLQEIGAVDDCNMILHESSDVVAKAEDVQCSEASEEIVLKTLNGSFIPMLVPGTGASSESIVVEPEHQILLLGSEQRQLHLQLGDQEGSEPLAEDSEPQYEVAEGQSHFMMPKAQSHQQQSKKIIDKSDPRSRLHFVKYMKKDGKTIKIWECGLCGKEFRHQYTLMRHLPTHTDERNYTCTVCGKSFRQMSTLSQHRAIHSDARPYVCEVCKKTFNRVSTLISHRKTHLEVKPHKCQVCGKGFHQKGNLRNHIFTHTDERPYKCDICSKGFNQMSNLVCHKAHIHSTKPRYVCQICQREFSRRFSLRSHEEYKHGIRYRGGERKVEFDPTHFQEIVNRKQKIRAERNVRIIRLPNGDRTLANIRDVNSDVHTEQNDKPPVPPMRPSRPPKAPLSGVLIDPIQTKAMQTARELNQTPFALLKPAKGIPVLVKVMPALNNKEMLVPATAEDLKSAGKITVSPNVSSVNNVKAVQIKVPVVATVTQRIAPDGQLVIHVEAPILEQTTAVDEPAPESRRVSWESKESHKMMATDGDGLECVLKVNDIAVDDMQEGEENTAASSQEETGSPDGLRERLYSDTEAEGVADLLDLASTGEFQFIRTGDDGSYQVLSQEEIAAVIKDPGQVISIETYNDGNSSVNDLSLNGLVDVMRSAGFMVTEEDKRIVISGGEDVTDAITDTEHIYNEEKQVVISDGDNSTEMVIEDNQPQYMFVATEADAPDTTHIVL
ncbi:zinc finger and BTB domain-containing protein 24-like isoform X2 [Bacillus rossius redtenbacheri]|uniref:zinc finger and BTB domain-containing protein 24-like isoform X2 n=1 Tax=Bacillus rossius redtenbacheri TaxID=93214 RepID=UPI002FDECDD6